MSRNLNSQRRIDLIGSSVQSNSTQSASTFMSVMGCLPKATAGLLLATGVTLMILGACGIVSPGVAIAGGVSAMIGLLTAGFFSTCGKHPQENNNTQPLNNFKPV